MKAPGDAEEWGVQGEKEIKYPDRGESTGMGEQTSREGKKKTDGKKKQKKKREATIFIAFTDTSQSKMKWTL